MVKVRILQLEEKFMRDFGFESYEYAKQQAGGFDLERYETMYECERDNEYDEDEAFVEFNLGRPEDFKGHSLSVSDVVMIDNKICYCDIFGWTYL